MFLLTLAGNQLNAQNTIVKQDFDGGSPGWEYQSNVDFFSHKGSNTQNNVYPAGDGWNNDGFFGLLDDTDWDGNISYSGFSDSVLAVCDLDDEDDFGTDKAAKVTFDKVNVSGYNSIDLSFDYELVSFSASDYIKYEVFEDGAGQGQNSLSGSGNETFNVSSGTKNVRLVFRIEQNGQSEYAGIDNIKLEGSAKNLSEPDNQPSNFSADSLSNSQIKLTWTDALAGNQAPDGYLIKAEKSGGITAPTDGTDPTIDKDLSDGSAVVKVGHGTGGSYTFSGLSKATEYDFQIWSFTNAEGNIDFLTSTAGPTANESTYVNEQIRTESFETTGSYTYPNGNGGSGEDIFDRVKGSDYLNNTEDNIYANYDQSYYIAAEDIDDATNLSSSDGIVKISNIDIKNYQDLRVKASLAAGANSGYESSDGIEVEVKVDNGSWSTIADFKGNSNDKLQEDTDLNGTADGAILNGDFEDFIWDVDQSGDQLSLRVTVTLNAGNEEAAFDHIRVTGRPPKKWDGEANDGKWSSADNWDPNGVPAKEDKVILDDTHIGADYTVNLDQNLSNKEIQSVEILPAQSQSIDLARASALGTFKLLSSKQALIIDDGGRLIDSTSGGLPTFSNNGDILIKKNGVYKVINNSRSVNTGSLVDGLASASSSDGKVVYETNGGSLSASGKTYPTSLTLRIRSGSNDFNTSGSNPFTIEGDFTIGSSVTYDATSRSSGGDLVIKGDLTVNGTLNLNNSAQTLKLNGSNGQNLNGFNKLQKFTVDNSSGVTLNSNFTISSGGSLNLTNGVLSFANSSDKLILESGVSVSGADATSYVDGKIQKKGTADFTFPTGNAGQWAPIAISNLGSNSQTFTAEYNKSDPTANANLSATLKSGVNNISAKEYWTLDQNSGSANVNVTLYWKSGMNHDINNFSDLIVVRDDGTDWVNEGNTGGSNSSSTPGNVKSGTVNNFSPFTFGSTSSNNNPLPVELLYFQAQKHNDHAELKWATASETNNSHFIVQKRVGEKWKNIGRKQGRGTTTRAHTYYFMDSKPAKGVTNYYRLKQTDYNGDQSFSMVRNVKFEEEDGKLNVINSKNSNPVINYKGDRSLGIETVLLTVDGQVLNTSQIQLGENKRQVNLPIWDNLPHGAYLLQLNVDGDKKVVKLIK